jgi:hypothetical protein
VKITDREKALYEAAHAVVAIHLGRGVRYVTIEPTVRGRYKGSYKAHTRLYSCSNVTHRTLIDLAHAIVEKRLHGRYRAGSLCDRDKARGRFELMGHDRTPARVYRQADEIVDQLYPLIERVADVLVKQKRLTGDEVRSIMTEGSSP